MGDNSHKELPIILLTKTYLGKEFPKISAIQSHFNLFSRIISFLFTYVKRDFVHQKEKQLDKAKIEIKPNLL